MPVTEPPRPSAAEVERELADHVRALAGPDAVLEAHQRIFEAFAGSIFHVGSRPGQGQAMKLLNNFLAMGYGALYSEALAIARKSGLTPEQFDSVIRPGRLSNGFYQTFMKWTLEHDENAHKFAISNAHKDMAYLTNLCTALGLVNPVQSAVKNSYASMEAAGEGERYLPMLADFIARQNGIDPD